ncbi:MAG: hypothetical protein ABEJ98_04870 [Candidatus Nanohaloarchaea archaeon]
MAEIKPGEQETKRIPPVGRSGKGTRLDEFGPVKVDGLEKPALPAAILEEHGKRYGGEVETDAGGNWRDVRAVLDDGSREYHARETSSGKTQLRYSMQLDDIEFPERYVDKVWEDEIGTIKERVELVYEAALETAEDMLPVMASEKRYGGENNHELDALSAEIDRLGGDVDTIADNYYSEHIGDSKLLTSYGEALEQAPDFEGEITQQDSEEELQSRNPEYLKLYLQTVAELALEKYAPRNVQSASESVFSG